MSPINCAPEIAMPTLMMINLKGGVAKTTTTVAIADCLASAGHRTLVIDADHQAMSSEMLLGESRFIRLDTNKRTLHDLMGAMMAYDFDISHFERYVTRTASNIGGGLDTLAVISCSPRIDDVATLLSQRRTALGSSEAYQKLLQQRRTQMAKWVSSNFDFVLIDCPPSLALQVRFLLSITTAYIIPCVPDRLSARGSVYLVDRLRRHGYKVPGLGTLWTLYRHATAMHREFVTGAARWVPLLQRLPQPFKTLIPTATAIPEAMDPTRTPRDFRGKYKTEFAQLFEDLADEINQRLWKLQPASIPTPAVPALANQNQP